MSNNMDTANVYSKITFSTVKLQEVPALHYKHIKMQLDRSLGPQCKSCKPHREFSVNKG